MKTLVWISFVTVALAASAFGGPVSDHAAPHPADDPSALKPPAKQ